MVNTSRPAHVAIFEIYPGRGVGLLYPAYRGERNYLYGGLNSIFLTQSRDYYSYFQPAPFFASASREGPRYLYMIASDAPLRLGSFLGAPGALRRELGLSRYTAASPYGLMDDLADLVLPYGEAGDWTDDVYAVWPDRSYGGDYQAQQFIRVECGDGRVISGPAYYVYGACARADEAPPLGREPEQPADSSGTQPPSRRRPEPTEPMAEGTVTTPPPVVEVIPEPEPARRPGARGPERVHEGQSTDSPRERDTDAPRVERRHEPRAHDAGSRPEPQVERRAEPAQPRVERPEPRVERPEPPRVERPEPRVAAPSVESPRSESGRSETPSR